MEENHNNESPLTLDQVINDLVGFGLEENEEILTIKSAGKEHRLRISNIPTEKELEALLAVETVKGYSWIQSVKAEILSRSISWIDGISLKNLKEEDRWVTDPRSKEQMQWQPALRNVILGWGMEVMNVLWKVFMTHSQRIEDRLKDAFPDSAVMTDVEKRFMDLAVQEVEEQARELIKKNVDKLNLSDEEEKDEESEK